MRLRWSDEYLCWFNLVRKENGEIVAESVPHSVILKRGTEASSLWNNTPSKFKPPLARSLKKLVEGTYKIFDNNPIEGFAHYCGFVEIDKDGVVVRINDNLDIKIGDRLPKDFWYVLLGDKYFIPGVGPYASALPIKP
jgi:hypothetical protein